jgi:hypothetical protein
MPSIPRPEHWIRGVRTNDSGEQQLVFVGYVASAVPDGEMLHVKSKGPEGLLDGRPLPFQPPMFDHCSSPEAFEFYWRILDYVFGLEDPRAFPPLSPPLPEAESAIVARYIRTTQDLAASAVVNAIDESFVVNIADETDDETIKLTLSERDRQVGFAALLRHCDSVKEDASFHAVASLLTEAAEAFTDDLRQHRLAPRGGSTP